MDVWSRLVALVLVGMVIAGCTHNLKTLTDEKVYARTSTDNLASMDGEGNLQAAYPGLGPTQLMQDESGNWTHMPGPVGVLSAPIHNGVAYIISPKDVRIEQISYTPDPCAGEPALQIVGLEANISVPLQQHVEAIKVHLPALQGMVKEEALATVEKWRVAATITPTVADMLTAIITSLM